MLPAQRVQIQSLIGTKIPYATWCDKEIKKNFFLNKNQIVLGQYVRHANTNLDILSGTHMYSFMLGIYFGP